MREYVQWQGARILRFYLMMAVVIIAGFTGYWLMGFLALPIFISVMMGVSFNPSTKFEKRAKELIRLEVFSRSRFLPTEKSGKVTVEEYKKAVDAARELMLSITRQIDEEVYW